MKDQNEPNGSKMDNVKPSPVCNVRTLLEAVSAASQVCPWGVSAVPSAGCFFVWDARDDSSFAVLESICGQFGTVDQSASIEAGGQTIIGCIVKPDDTSDLEDAAGRLRVAYSGANGKGGADTPDPFQGIEKFLFSCLPMLAKQSSDLNEVFRAVINQSGLSRYEIAKRLGVTESALGRPYNGQRGVPWELLQSVAKVAGMQVTARAEVIGSTGRDSTR